MRFHLPFLVAAGLLTTLASASAQSPTPSSTPATASPAASPTKRQRHKKADASAPASTPATASSPAANQSPAKKTEEERAAAKQARLDKLAAMTPAPGGGPGMVWVNSESKAYHDQSSPYYGKTKHGKYLTEEAAKAEGDHPAGQRHNKSAKPQ